MIKYSAETEVQQKQGTEKELYDTIEKLKEENDGLKATINRIQQEKVTISQTAMATMQQFEREMKVFEERLYC